MIYVSNFKIPVGFQLTVATVQEKCNATQKASDCKPSVGNSAHVKVCKIDVLQTTAFANYL